jgi:glycerophosphoryl diester phosphodiesterase
MPLDKTGDWPYPFWISHRGGGRFAPENTLAAMRVGAAHGFKAFEFDVKLSADEVLFLLHDSTLDRTSNGRGPAADRSWAELSLLDAGGWHSAAFAGEPVASLQAVSAFALRQGFALNLEIKPNPGQAERTGEATARFVVRHWQEATAPTPLLSSFEPPALQGALRAAPQLPRSLLFDSLQADWLALAQSLRCVSVGFERQLVDAALIAEAHAQGLRVLAYTVNDEAGARRLQAIGIDGLFTDELERFAP